MGTMAPSLPLDPRQRAMLQEMGVRLWLPGDGSSGDRPAAPPAVRPRAAPQIPATSEPQRSAATSVPTRPAAVPTNTAQATPTGTAAAEHALLRPPRALYPDADPAQCPPALGNAWLKTGSLRDVAAVAGYVNGRSGQRYSLVALVNHDNAGATRAALDLLVDWVAQDP